MSAYPPEASRAGQCRHYESHHPYRAAHALETVAKGISRQAVSRSPDNASGRIEEQESSPVHAIDAGEKGCECAQHGHEPAEEHDLAAMSRKEVLPELDVALVDSCQMATAEQKRVPESPAEYIPDAIADDRADRGRQDDELDVQPMRRAGEDRRGDERGFAGHWNPHALQRHSDGDNPVSVGRDQGGELLRHWRYARLPARAMTGTLLPTSFAAYTCARRRVDVFDRNGKLGRLVTVIWPPATIPTVILARRWILEVDGPQAFHK